MKCFCCDGGLCNWEPGDIPADEHARLFPYCEFIRLTKPNSQIGNGTTQQASESPEEANELATRVINEWMKMPIVQQLVAHSEERPSMDVIKAILHQRWIERRIPFDSFDQLYGALVKSNYFSQ